MAFLNVFALLLIASTVDIYNCQLPQLDPLLQSLGLSDLLTNLHLTGGPQNQNPTLLSLQTVVDNLAKALNLQQLLGIPPKTPSPQPNNPFAQFFAGFPQQPNNPQPYGFNFMPPLPRQDNKFKKISDDTTEASITDKITKA